MQRATALEQALYLLLLPGAIRQFRGAPLPADVSLLLRVLAGEEDARDTAVEVAAKPPETVARAAEFYAREILLAPDASHYRVLGCEPDAPREQLRANMILLMRWLHPDTSVGTRDDELFEKVRRAWHVMRSEELRMAYDQALFKLRPAQLAEAPPQAGIPAVAIGTNPFLDRATGSRGRRLLKGAIYLTAAALMIALIAFMLDNLSTNDELDIGVARARPGADRF